MSKWRKPLKNRRRIDARYFLNETVEEPEVVENSSQQEKLKNNFHDFSFDGWVTEGADKGTPEWSKPTKDTEADPIDYDHGEEDEKIGGEVVEGRKTTIAGEEEEEENYGEPPEEFQGKEIEDADLDES